MKKSIISVLLTLVMVLGLSSAIKAETLTLNGTKAYKYSLEEGIYMMDLTANANTTAQFYTSKKEAKKGYGITGIGDSYINGRAHTKKQVAFTVDEKGTYYLSLSTESSHVQVDVNVYKADVGGILTNGQPLLGTSNADNKTIAYYQYKMKKDGYVSLSIDGINDLSSNVIVCDETKKAMHYWAYGYTDSRSLGAIALKKGTYYFAVKSYDPVYNITATATSRKITGGLKKKKAKMIKRKKTYKGIVALNGSTSWYKYKLTKTKALSMSFTGTSFYGGSAGGMNITVYKGKQKLGTQTFMENTQSATQSYVISHGKTYGKADAGTYYIKITNYKKGCGIYQFSLN